MPGKIYDLRRAAGVSAGGDPVETAQLFSKEIENDAENVDALLDGAYALPGLTDRNLLALARMTEQ